MWFQDVCERLDAIKTLGDSACWKYHRNVTKPMALWVNGSSQTLPVVLRVQVCPYSPSTEEERDSESLSDSPEITRRLMGRKRWEAEPGLSDAEAPSQSAMTVKVMRGPLALVSRPHAPGRALRA